jgi:hypothetical protein
MPIYPTTPRLSTMGQLVDLVAPDGFGKGGRYGTKRGRMLFCVMARFVGHFIVDDGELNWAMTDSIR